MKFILDVTILRFIHFLNLVNFWDIRIFSQSSVIKAPQADRWVVILPR
jgi:hypothetical protein